MTINKKFINKFGMVNPTSFDIVSENALLTSMQLINILKLYRCDEIARLELNKNVGEYIDSCKTNKVGLFNQYPESYMNLPSFSNDDDKYMSKDQLISIGCYNRINGNYIDNYNIYNYLIMHFGFYNNMQTFLPRFRFMGFQAINLFIYFGTFKNNFLLRTYKYCEKQIYDDCNDNNRSTGALKAFTILSTLYISNGHFDKLKELMVKLKGEFLEFYKEEEHPIRRILDEQGITK